MGAGSAPSLIATIQWQSLQITIYILCQISIFIKWSQYNSQITSRCSKMMKVVISYCLFFITVYFKIRLTLHIRNQMWLEDGIIFLNLISNSRLLPNLWKLRFKKLILLPFNFQQLYCKTILYYIAFVYYIFVYVYCILYSIILFYKLIMKIFLNHSN